MAIPDHPLRPVARGLRRSTLHSGDFTITRLRQDAAVPAEFALDEPEDAYVLMVKLVPPHTYDLFVDGQRRAHFRDQPGQPGNLCLVHRESRIRLAVAAPFDMVEFGFPQRALEHAAAGSGQAPSGPLRLPAPGTVDPAVAALGTALLPALEYPARASPLFVSHMTLALGAHLLHAYGTHAATPVRGGLAPWQERRAKEILRANLDGNVRIADIAAECRLSAGHFATSFKRSTGVSPTGWLARQRIDHARGLLRRGDLSLSEVAAAAGFTDQAHFTRAFSRLVGVPPGTWRRQQ
jgi:AraC family transcriptional regulator